MSFKIILITPELFLEHEIEILISLFQNGLQHLHVRKPQASKSELKAYLQQIPKKYHKKIVIHTQYALAEELGLKGIHLTEKTRKKAHKQKIISASFHTISDILRSKKKYEYVFLGPVFDSLSSSKKHGSFGFQELDKLFQKRKNVMALGGIQASNMKQIKQIGFAGAAMIGAIWQHKQPLAAFLQVQRKAAAFTSV
ncbi:MAG: thiamine phosphate synthase [Bacteroidetes bacterium]|nr:thiamine phosphate synthase [Bacteroidota bacterium]